MSTGYTGAINSYTDTTAAVRCIEDLINNVSPDEVPFTKVIGINSISDPTVFGTTYEWLEDELAPTSTTLNGAIASTTTTTCAVYTGAGTWIRVGHVLLIGSELIRVSGVSTDTLTIGRGFASTTAATASDGATVEIVGMALVEGNDAPASFKMDVSTGYNYTHIFQETVQITGTHKTDKQYGIKNSMSFQVAKKFKELAIQLERTCFLGQRAAGSASTARMMGGLAAFISGNAHSLSSAALTEKDVMDRLQAIFDDVGLGNKANLIVTNAWGKRKLASFYAPYARMERAERTGGVVVDRIDTDFGLIDVMLNTWCPASVMYFLNTNYIQIGPKDGRAFFKEPLAKSGDYEKVQIVGEYTLKCANDNAHAVITSMSTSS